MMLFRSLLFTPAIEPARMRKALGTSADGVIFDLEDGVAEDQKPVARERLAGFLDDLAATTHTDQPPIFVRVNGPASDHHLADLNAPLTWGLVRGVMVPKTESSHELRRLDERLGALEAEQGLTTGSLEIMPLVETAAGLRNAYDVAQSARVRRIAFGSIDYIADIRATWTPGGQDLQYARGKLVVDSRASGIEPPVDTIYPHIQDTEGLIREARYAKQLGFQGKLVIHPAQIEPVNAAFLPSETEVAWARRVVAAYAEAAASGRGVQSLDGELIEKPVAERARRIMELAEGSSGQAP
jgi:citrate lyase subunit beta/citryl-CoA lyase